MTNCQLLDETTHSRLISLVSLVISHDRSQFKLEQPSASQSCPPSLKHGTEPNWTREGAKCFFHMWAPNSLSAHNPPPRHLHLCQPPAPAPAPRNAAQPSKPACHGPPSGPAIPAPGDGPPSQQQVQVAHLVQRGPLISLEQHRGRGGGRAHSGLGWP